MLYIPFIHKLKPASTSDTLLKILAVYGPISLSSTCFMVMIVYVLNVVVTI